MKEYRQTSFVIKHSGIPFAQLVRLFEPVMSDEDWGSVCVCVRACVSACVSVGQVMCHAAQTIF